MQVLRCVALLAAMGILSSCAREESSPTEEMSMRHTTLTTESDNYSAFETQSSMPLTSGGDTTYTETNTNTFPVKHTALEPKVTTTTEQSTTTVAETTIAATTTSRPISETDTVAPILLNGGWGTTILRGSTFSLYDHVGYADNLDPSPTLTYTGEVNTDVCGTYPIEATVTDAAGNTISWKLSIQVVESMPSSSGGGTADRLPFETLVREYAGENIRFGIDVSKWQGEIDFEAVKNAGCSFVIMRIGYYYGETEEMDEYYLANMKAAKDAGLEVGVYLYTIANNEEEVRENARWIAEQLDGMELDFPVVFDWERFSHFQQFGMSIRDLNELFVLFAEEMERYGYSAMLYSSKTYLESFWYVQENYPVWLAHYTAQTDYAGDYMMWQMSCRGSIPGINTDVDFDILYDDRLNT